MKTWLSEDPGNPVEEPHAQAVTPVVAHSPEAADGHGALPARPVTSAGDGHVEPASMTPAEMVAIGPTSPWPSNATEAKTQAQRIPRPRLRARIAANSVWRTRGIWLGGTGVALAMFAQKTLTVDGQVITSIRWYALAIFVVLLAWLGTYKNKSLLAEPSRPIPAESPSDVSSSTTQRGVSATLSGVMRGFSDVMSSSVLVVLGCLALYMVLRFPLGWVWAAPWPALIFAYAVLRELYGTATANIGTALLLYAPLYVLLGWQPALPIPALLVAAALAYELWSKRKESRATPVPEVDAPATPAKPPSETPSTTLPVRTKRQAPQPQTTLPVRRSSPGKESSAPLAKDAAPPKIQNDAAKSDTKLTTSKAPRFNLPWLVTARQRIARYPFLAWPWPRYVIALSALGLNWYCANLLRKDYFSPIGGYGWLLSLVILALAFVRERRKEVPSADPHSKDVEDRTQLRLPRWLEVGILLGIFMLALGLRVFRLDDWTGAMHGDEGEFGTNALFIVNGDHISPFMTGWFFHPNFSFFGIAAMMKIFGTGLFGLRILSALLGALMVVPFYLLVRLWFGVRMAIIASLLLAFMDVGLYFGKLGLNNIETPFFIVTGLYFFFKGVRSLKTLDFVLAGYAFMLTLYFYFGGRLTPFLVIAIVGYMFLLMPVLRLPGAYLRTRKTLPQLTRFRALDHALWLQIRSVSQYVGKIAVLAIACFCLASPWLVYFQDRQIEMNTRANEKLIFNPGNLGVITSQSGAVHGPLYLGWRAPTPTDIYPFLPIVFEQTPTSVQLTDDGFWPRVIWSQTTKTLSMFTYRKDESSFFTFTQEAAAKPIEAAFLILGIAWAMWRWRDTRMAVLSMWFWSTILIGGALTIDAPYMPRLVGVVPALAIFIAIPLNKLSAEFVGALGGFKRVKAWARLRTRLALAVGTLAFAALLAYLIVSNVSDQALRAIALGGTGLALLVYLLYVGLYNRWQRVGRRLGVALTGGMVAVLLLYLGLENTFDYFSRYMASQPNREHLGTANFVRWMNEKAISEGRPKPQYYDMASPFFYWGYGINRFLNYGTQGDDMLNPTNELPILNNDDRDVVFMAWDYTRQYLPVFQSYYPGGETAPYVYGPASNPSTPFVYYRVKKEQINARRRSIATYAPAGGSSAIQREEDGVGSTAEPPANLNYPVQASWSTNVVAPSAGTYRFSLEAPGDGSFVVDGSPILTTTASSLRMEGEVTLARGPHEVVLKGALGESSHKVKLEWSTGGASFAPVPRRYLWNGPGRGLYGEIRSYGGGSLLSPDTEQDRLLTARVDGFLGFRYVPAALPLGLHKATWKGTFSAPQGGQYTFSVCSNGGSVVLIDRQLLVDNTRGPGCPQEVSAQVELAQGEHDYELRYAWTGGGTETLEAYWAPPGNDKRFIGPDMLQATGGIFDPNSLAAPLPPVQLEPDAPAVRVEPEAVIGGSDALSRPKGIGVDGEGNIYVGDRGNHRIVVYSSDGKQLREWGKAAPEVKEGETPPPHQPGEFADISDLAVTQDGTVYVFDSAPRVQAFKLSGEYIGSFEYGPGELYGPNGIADDVPSTESAGRTLGLYIAVTGQGRIFKLPSVLDVSSGKAKLPDDTENVTGTGEGAGAKLEQPVDAAADPSGTRYLYEIDLNNNNERIARLKPVSGTPGQTREWKIDAQWSVNIGHNDGGSRLAVSRDGKRVYMSDPDRARIAILNVGTGEVSYFGKPGGGPGEFTRLTGITVGPDGRIYVVDSENNNVQVFSPEKVGK
jgi:sugar lactone lactonase YvrE